MLLPLHYNRSVLLLLVLLFSSHKAYTLLSWPTEKWCVCTLQWDGREPMQKQIEEHHETQENMQGVASGSPKNTPWWSSKKCKHANTWTKQVQGDLVSVCTSAVLNKCPGGIPWRLSWIHLIQDQTFIIRNNIEGRYVTTQVSKL